MIWGLPIECEDCEWFGEVCTRDGEFIGVYVCSRDRLAITQVEPDDDACPKWELRVA